MPTKGSLIGITPISLHAAALLLWMVCSAVVQGWDCDCNCECDFDFRRDSDQWRCPVTRPQLGCPKRGDFT
ncbi:hypothetical protein JB92DRAFT_3067666 [Gautieria morchelliformis]|nr:hypothetical protein JB92DRAFT_3067666 [Gautieria morchelliformis]